MNYENLTTAEAVQKAFSDGREVEVRSPGYGARWFRAANDNAEGIAILLADGCEYRATLTSPATQGAAVRWEYRTRQVGNSGWSAWIECSRETYDECAAKPVEGGWAHEVRCYALVTGTAPAASPRDGGGRFDDDLRKVLGLNEAEGDVLIANAVVRIKRLTAELAVAPVGADAVERVSALVTDWRANVAKCPEKGCPVCLARSNDANALEAALAAATQGESGGG